MKSELNDYDLKAKLIQHISKRINLNIEEQKYVCSMLRVRRLLAKQYLVQQGDICRYESFVCKGFLRSFIVDEKGNDHTLQFAMEDWWISDLRSYTKQQPATRNIITLEASELLQIDREQMDELFENIPSMERFWRMMNETSWISADERILNNIALNGAARYEAFIAKYPNIEQRLPQKHIATYLGMTPVFLSQIRKNYLSSL